MSSMDPLTVLLVSDDEAFIRQLTDRWQTERVVPTFVVAADAGAFRSNFDLAIVDCAKDDVRTAALGSPVQRNSAPSSDHDTLRSQLSQVENTGRPVITFARTSETLEFLRRQFPRVLALCRHDSWPDTVVTVAIEILRRVEAVKRAERAEQLNLSLKRNATLGQYVIDMRHSLNNALTSVLGNAELLLLEPGAFSAATQSQLDTIRHMALRMHEVLQRFSSLEKELSFAEKQTLKEGSSRPFLAAAP